MCSVINQVEFWTNRHTDKISRFNHSLNSKLRGVLEACFLKEKKNEGKNFWGKRVLNSNEEVSYFTIGMNIPLDEHKGNNITFQDFNVSFSMLIISFLKSSPPILVCLKVCNDKKCNAWNSSYFSSFQHSSYFLNTDCFILKV